MSVVIKLACVPGQAETMQAVFKDEIFGEKVKS